MNATSNLRYDAVLGSTQELNDIGYLVTVGNLFYNLVHGIEHAGLAMEHQSISVSDVLLHFLVNAISGHHHGIRSIVAYRLTTCDDIRRHILGKGTTRLDHSTMPHTSIGVFYHRGGENHAIANLAISCDLGTIPHHTVITHLRVMGYVGTFHQEVIVTYQGLSAFKGSAIDNHVFPENIVVAYHQLRIISLEVEILRYSRQHRTLVHLVVITHARAIENAHEGKDEAIVTYHYVILNVSERKHLAVVAYPRLGRDLCSWTYLASHILFVFKVKLDYLAPPPRA